jgi:Mg2+/citrate symporter
VDELKVAELVVSAFIVWRVFGLAAALCVSVWMARKERERRQLEHLAFRVQNGLSHSEALRACGFTCSDVESALRRLGPRP